MNLILIYLDHLMSNLINLLLLLLLLLIELLLLKFNLKTITFFCAWHLLNEKESDQADANKGPSKSITIAGGPVIANPLIWYKIII